MDYVKYALKPEDELSQLLDGADSIYILHCQKCYKEYDIRGEPECKKLNLSIASAQEKIAGCSRINFLCAPGQSEELARSLASEFDNFGVIACGLGIQAVSGALPGKNIIALADSIPRGKNATPARTLHGISLDEAMCSACGQCYLDITGGICPVSNCAKSLLNGPCGGASEGKCEVDKNRNCAWEDIFKRLKKQEKTFSKNVETRDFSLFPFDEKESLEALNRSRREESFPGGVHPAERKEETENKPLARFPEPEIAAIFLSQHTGNPAKPAVKPGETVKIGQEIGSADGFISSSVHASISGKVLAIEERLHPAFLKKMPAVIIENDGESALDGSIEPLKDNASPEETVKYLEDKGIVGLGGAMFPSHVKLRPPKPVDTLIINGAECEPFLSSDNRLMLEYTDDIISGIELMMGILDIKSAVIAVEENKPEALSKLAESASDGIRTASLRAKYPQGAEKMLIKSILDRRVPDGGLPMDAGAAVFNVSTVFAVHRAITGGMPLIERALTVSGDYIGEKGNFTVKIGTPLPDILARCTGASAAETAANRTIKMGGPMMGILLTSPDTYTIKGASGFTIQEKPAVEFSDERECIKCGRCVEVCPMELEPLEYVYLARSGKWEELEEYRLSSCFECGACEYVCSAKISILNLIKKAKANVCVKA